MHKSQQLYAQRERRSFMAELAEEKTRCAVDIAANSGGSGRKKRQRDPVDSRQYKRLENRVKKFKVDAQEWKKKHKNLQGRYDSIKAKYEKLQSMFGIKKYKRLEDRLAKLKSKYLKLQETYGKKRYERLELRLKNMRDKYEKSQREHGKHKYLRLEVRYKTLQAKISKNKLAAAQKITEASAMEDIGDAHVAPSNGE